MCSPGMTGFLPVRLLSHAENLNYSFAALLTFAASLSPTPDGQIRVHATKVNDGFLRCTTDTQGTHLDRPELNL